jgi:predicted DCC family thiol-disulfide oxidoreductase YuxK
MYAALQGEKGQEILKHFGLNTNDFDSFVMVIGDKYYTKSSAALQAMKIMGGLWSLLYVFIIIPKPIRDFFYNLIAKNRYKMFGKQESCLLPRPEWKERFLD